MKTCNVCNQTKELSEFYKKERGKFGVEARCKCCRLAGEKNQKAEYRKLNREILNTKNREYEKLNAEKIALRKAKYRNDNKDKIAAQKKLYHDKPEIKKRRNEWAKNKRHTDLNFRLKKILRTRIANFLRGIGEKSGSAIDDLGCSIAELKIHIENQFQPGMSWDNYGYHTWHIDHIIPLSAFDLTNREQFLKACHYTNLQPLWAEENWKKNRFYK